MLPPSPKLLMLPPPPPLLLRGLGLLKPLSPPRLGTPKGPSEARKGGRRREEEGGRRRREEVRNRTGSSSESQQCFDCAAVRMAKVKERRRFPGELQLRGV